MQPWRDLLREIEEELTRCSQQVGEVRILPAVIRIQLPEPSFRKWSPVLAPVTAEIGEALVAWARERSLGWSAGTGPALEVLLEDRPEIHVTVSMTSDSPG